MREIWKHIYTIYYSIAYLISFISGIVIIVACGKAGSIVGILSGMFVTIMAMLIITFIIFDPFEWWQPKFED